MLSKRSKDPPILELISLLKAGKTIKHLKKKTKTWDLAKQYGIHQAECSVFSHPLHVAIELKNLEYVMWLVLEKKCSPNCKDSSGWTALHYACQGENLDLDILEFLLDKADANINLVDSNGSLPLHYFVRNSPFLEDAPHRLSFSSSSSSRSADPIQMEESYLATKKSHKKKSKMFEEASNRMLSKRDFTNRFFSVLGKLIDSNNLNQNNSNEETPVTLATRQGHPDVLFYLLQKDPDLTVCNLKGFNCLHFAILYNNIKAARILTTKDATLWDVKNDKNKLTPLELAKLHGRIDFINLCEEQKARRNRETIRKTTSKRSCKKKIDEFVAKDVNRFFEDTGDSGSGSEDCAWYVSSSDWSIASREDSIPYAVTS